MSLDVKRGAYKAWVRGEVFPGYESYTCNDQAIHYVEALEDEVLRLEALNNFYRNTLKLKERVISNIKALLAGVSLEEKL
jgi:cyclopropane fatty-acyl-phospholipid synthase-like methyltransferase